MLIQLGVLDFRSNRRIPIHQFALLLACLCFYLGVSAPVFANDPESDTTDTASTMGCGEQSDGSSCEEGDPGEIPGGDLPSILAGNPINFLSGNKQQREVDFAIPGSKLSFRRTYNSENAIGNIGIGKGWSHTYAVSLYKVGAQLQIVQSNGTRLSFTEFEPDKDGRAVWRSAHSNEGFLLQTDEHRYAWHLSDGRILRFQGSFLADIEWPGHQYLKLFYKNGRLSEVTDETGRLLLLEYHPDNALVEYTESRYGSAAGHLSVVTLPDGKTIHYDYDQLQNLTRARFSDETAREYHYEDELYPNHLTGISDRLGVRAATWIYDDSGRAISSERAKGLQRLSIEYPDLLAVNAGDIVESTITGSLGNQSIYTWIKPENGQRARLLSSAGSACTTCPITGFNYDYDDAGRLLSKTRNKQGTAIGVHNTRMVYDEFGRVIERWVSDEFAQEKLSERLEYDGQSVQPYRRYAPSLNPDAEQLTEIERDEQGLVTRITMRGFTPQLDASGVITDFTPIEHTTRIGYESGRMVSLDGPRDDIDDVARFGWDKNNRMISMAMPDSPVIRITQFDALGRAVSFVKGSAASGGSPITLSYNLGGQVESVTQLGRTLSMRYNAEGRLIGVVNRVGREMTLGYDDAGQLVSVEYVGGQRMTTDYDDEGRVIGQSLLDQYGSMIRSVNTLYDVQGRVASVSRSTSVAGMPAAQSTEIDFEYDHYNRATLATDRSSGATIDVTYNALGNLAGMSTHAGRSLKLGYDAIGTAQSVTDSRNNETQFIKDDFGRVVAVISADTGLSRYVYDDAGNRVLWTSPSGESTQYTWDAANRPTQIRNGEGTTVFAYDADTGLLAETSNGVATERFRYTRHGQLQRHERTIDQASFVTEYQYDDVGRMIGRQLPDGQSLRYHYYQDDKLLGRLRAVTRSSAFGLRQELLLAEIDEDASDGITGFIAHNGKRTTRTHASDGRITRIEVSEVMSLDYRYDDIGRIIGIVDNGVTQSFSYSQGYLSSAQTLTGNYVFDYDIAGNRIAKQATTADGRLTQKTYQYSPNGRGNRLLSASSGLNDGAIEAIDYNASGSPITHGSIRYEYNIDQRPVRVYKDDQLLAEYAYNSFGERIKKVSYSDDQKRVTYFLYDGHRITASIPAANTSEMEHTLYLHGAPVVQLQGKHAYAVHTDKLGTAHMLSDESGGIAWQAEYSPFGKASILINDVVFNHRLPGHYEDSETGTHYNYLRDYDPESGRYLTSDPISISGGLNTYLYANADPLNTVDVLGLRPDDSAALPDFGGGGPPGTQITEAQYLELHGYALNGQGLEYFQLLFDITNHGIFEDFANSYQGELTTPAMLLLRELFMRNGTNNIEKIFCGIGEGNSVYLIPEIDVLANTVFQAAGIGRATGSFVVGTVTSLWNLGVGTINFAFDATLGIQGDVQNMLADYFNTPAMHLPEWYPSYGDAVQTLSDLGTSTLSLAENIRENPELIWQGLTDPYVQQWAERRYGEAITTATLDIAAMFAGVGALAKVSKLSDVLTALKRADTASPNELANELDEIAEAMREQGEDLDLLRRAAEEAGLDDIAQLSPNQIGRAGENAVNAAHDIGGKQTITINGRDRIPDGINETTLSEIKNVKKLSYTQQLRDFADIAAERGLTYDLYVRPSTELTGPLLEAIEAGTINLKFIPGAI